MHDRSRAQQALFDAYARADAHGRRAVLAVGQRVVMANSPMQTLVGPGDQESLQDHVRFAMHRRDTVDERVDLPSGTRVRLRGSSVTVGPDVAGMVATVSLIPDARSGPPSPAAQASSPGGNRAPARAAGSRSPAWCAAASTVETALRASTPVLLLGEHGSGRLQLATGLHRAVHDAGRAVVLEADEIEASPADVAALLMGDVPDDVLHVLRNVDRLSPPAAGALVHALGRTAGGPGAVAATASEPDVAYRPLLAVFRASATMPPLRHRASDLPVLADDLLAALAPNRDVRLSREALRLLGRHRWPGNVTELRDALDAALSRRPVGVIEARDLPASCQSAPRSALRPVDEMERDAIVTALRDAAGNRSAAAGALGLGRSTLYRKIHQYGITL